MVLLFLFSLTDYGEIKSHCVWGGGKKCNKQFTHLFLINYREIILTCSKASA